MEINVKLNGADHTTDVEPRQLLVHVIRETLGYTGTHIGCDTTSCGACTVLLDGTPVKSCTVFGVQADGRAITTVEGMIGAEGLDPIQEGFKEEHGLQCGFCTPGMMLVAKHLLEENPQPSEDDIRWAISGNICRCTGYMNIVKAIQWAAQKNAGNGDDQAPPISPDSTADETGFGPEDSVPASDIADEGVTTAAPSGPQGDE